MELEVKKIPTHDYFLLPVAGENLNGSPAAFITKIKHENKVYEVFDYFVYRKNDLKPRALLMLAIGKDINEISLFNAYPNSEAIYLFVVKK
jgi:hypothetical protein